jgi:hypothetical protein
MTTLSIPLVALDYAPLARGQAAFESPVTIKCGAVALPDGTPFTGKTAGQTGFLVYRKPSSGAGDEVFDSANKQWKKAIEADSGQLKPQPFLYKEGDPSPWQGPFMAVADPVNFEAGTRSYYFRAFFSTAASDGTPVYGLGAPSATVLFLKKADAMLAGVKTDSPDNATEIQIFLKNSAQQIIGTVRVSNDGGQGRIELSNSAGGMVRLNASGDIELLPKTKVTVSTLEAQAITVNGRTL